MPYTLDEADQPATMNPHLLKQGEAGRENLGYIDSDYPALGVMDPHYDKWKETQNRLEQVGVGVDALSALPMVGGPKTLAKVGGELVNEVLTPKVGPRAVSGAVKLPGGMWHPEAVERLARELTVGPTQLDKNGPWAEKAVKNYLNRYAGTERDPLKDVEIPFGEGTRRWEDITDDVIKSTKAQDTVHPDYKGGAEDKGPAYYSERDTKVKPDEDIYNLKNPHDGGRVASRQALNSYLSHVGDFLRQNVDPSKLSQYDLVRAVKETSTNDARVAKETEKAQGASTAQLPLHKEYPDGFKWVEIKAPEKLSEEQAKGVKSVKDVNWKFGEKPGAYPQYVAVDTKGEPVRNTYTESHSFGQSPEEAWLSSRLAEEGNSLGHCVGGYCEDVSSGASKIYSLRDAKGRSHVTIEVKPTEEILDPATWFDEKASNFDKKNLRADGGDVLETQHAGQKWTDFVKNSKEYQDYLVGAKQSPEGIAQIKGKQNRAPNAEYLPYVQDFVRSNPWTKVGDLDNTGLRKVGGRLLDEDEFSNAALKHGVAEGGTTWPESLRRHLAEGIDAEKAKANWVQGAKDGQVKLKVPENFVPSREKGAASVAGMAVAGGGAAVALGPGAKYQNAAPPELGPGAKYQVQEDHSYDTDKDYAGKESEKSMIERFTGSKVGKVLGQAKDDILRGMAIPAEEYEHLADKAGGAVVDKTGSPLAGAAVKTLIESPPLGGIGKVAGEGAGLVTKAIGGVAVRLTGAPQRELTKTAMDSMRKDLLQSAGGAEEAHGLEQEVRKNTLSDLEAKSTESWGPKAPKRLQAKTPQGGAPKVDETLAATSSQIKENIRRADLLAEGASSKSKTEALNIYKNTITKARNSGMLSTQQYDSAMMDIDKIQSLEEKTKQARHIALYASGLAGVGFLSRHILGEIVK